MEPTLYYTTFTVVGWIDVFTRKEYVHEFLESLQHWQTKKELKIYAYVVMSNKVHLIFSPVNGKASELLAQLKYHTAQRMIQLIGKNEDECRSDWLIHMLSFFGKFDKQNNNFQFWMKEDQLQTLTGQDHISQKITFLHNRPVLQGIVSRPEHYLYSSANPYAKLEVTGYPNRTQPLATSTAI